MHKTANSYSHPFIYTHPSDIGGKEILGTAPLVSVAINAFNYLNYKSLAGSQFRKANLR